MRTRIRPGAGFVVACLVSIGALAPAEAATHIWTGSWDTAPVAGGDIIIRSGANLSWTAAMPSNVNSWIQEDTYAATVTIATVYGSTGFTSLAISGDCILSNGVWTHADNATVEQWRLKVSVGGNFTLVSNASINVVGLGYNTYNGPGYPGSYGGIGAIGTGPAYGSYLEPTNVGSGATHHEGGGAVHLAVSGSAAIDGAINASGVNGTYFTGSGGSVFLRAGTLAGAGSLRADGGFSTGGYQAGGGGRVAVVVTNAGATFGGFTGLMTAYGGRRNTTTEGGGPGTVYLETADQGVGNGKLIIDDNNLAGSPITGLPSAAIPSNQTWIVKSLVLTNNGILEAGSNSALNIITTNIVSTTLSTNGVRLRGGQLILPDGLLSITNWQLIADRGISITGNVFVRSGGIITHSPNAGVESNKLDLTLVGDLIVDAGGRIDVVGKGFGGGYGPGTPGTADNNHCGAAHGGKGGDVPAYPTITYGSVIHPVALGSGGAIAGDGYIPNSSGAGAILLSVSGVVTNNGTITASASDGLYARGSGGSVYILAGALAGGGTIRANGGSASNTRGGGGGRIALVVTNAGADFSALTLTNITAYCGTGDIIGGAGTVYLRTADQGPNEGVLIVDNNGIAGAATVISPLVTDASVADVRIQRSANLTIGSNQSLTVSGVFSNGAVFAAQNNGSLVFAGSGVSTSTVYGNSTFDALTCTVPGKTLRFAAGSSNAVQALGLLTFTGSVASNVVLRSTADGVSWKLNVSAAANQSVSCVDVKDSDASSGAPVTALTSTNSGGNTNWIFTSGPETLTWSGASNTVWGQAANWDLGRAPLAQDSAIIPSSMPRYPVLDASKTISGLQVQSGASLGLAGFNLTLSSNAVIAGTLSAAGTETIVFQRDANFTGGVFAAARSTVVIGGSQAQAINPAGLSFFKISLTNRTATVTFSGGLSAVEFRCEAAAGLPSMVFQQAATYTIRDLVLLGSTTATNITLRSSSAGQVWNLNVGAYSLVKGVDVRDSNASAGKTINPIASKDSGNNPNWTFGQDWSQWLGTSGTNFHLASNWSPAAVPGATARVLIESTNTASITNPVSIRQLIVGSGSQPAQLTVNTNLTVTEDMVVLNQGIAALNLPTVVSNDVVVLDGGTITHSANSNSTTEAYKVDLTVQGDLVVDLYGRIDVTGMGYAAGYGPGTPGTAGNNHSGAAHGGRGSEAPGYLTMTYGSVLHPVAIGSGGATPGFTPPSTGGGAISLTVSGAAVNNGTITASAYDGQYGRGSGGSVYILADTLSGGGTIRANGGSATSTRCGGGGRIALIVTGAGADFGGVVVTNITARGGVGGAGNGGAGTVYLQSTAQSAGKGIVTVDNNNQTGAQTEIPPKTNAIPSELERATIVVTNRAAMASTTNTTIGELLIYTNCYWTLTNWTVSVNQLEHSLENVTKRGPGATNRVDHYDQILWIGHPPGTVFVIH